MNVNSRHARQLLALAATTLRRQCPDATVLTEGLDGEPLSISAACLAGYLEREVELSLEAAPVYREFRLQQDYNGKRAGDPDCWQWIDTGINLKAKDEADARKVARGFANRPGGGQHRFCRGHRLVEKFSTSAFRIVEENLS